jgi:hypothetical protein
MASNTTSVKLRLALRREGDFWNAYVALENTMDGAVLIGSLAMGLASVPKFKKAFMRLMQDGMSHHIKDIAGRVGAWNDPVAAPEHEKAGRA